MVVELVGGFGMPAKGGHQIGDVEARAVTDRLTGLQGLDDGKFVGMGLHEGGESQDEPLAVGRGHPSPRAVLEGGAGRSDCPVDVGGVALGNLSQLGPGGRVESGEGPPRGGLDATTADKGPGGRIQRGGQSGRVGKVECHQLLLP